MNLLCKNKEDLEKIQEKMQTGHYQTAVYSNFTYPEKYPCIVIPILVNTHIQDNTIQKIPQQLYLEQTLKFGYIYLDEMKSVSFDTDMKDLLK